METVYSSRPHAYEDVTPDERSGVLVIPASEKANILTDSLPELAGYYDGVRRYDYYSFRAHLLEYCCAIDWSAVSPEDTATFLARLNAFDESERQRVDSIEGRKGEFDRLGISVAAEIVQRAMPAELLRGAYFGDRQLHEEFEGVFRSAWLAYPRNKTLPELALKLCGSEDGVRWLPTGCSPVLDHVRQSKRKQVFAVDVFGLDLALRDDSDSPYAYGEYLSRRISGLLRSGLGASDDLSRVVGEAIADSEVNLVLKQRFDPNEVEEEPSQARTRITEDMQKLRAKFGKVGVDSINAIHDKFGIIDPRKYRLSDLEKLKKLVHDSDERKEFVKYLNLGDTTAIFCVTREDESGAFRNEFSLYDKPDGRTLPFEITDPADLHRIMMKLRAIGIRPCHAVAASHGSEDGMWFGRRGIREVKGRRRFGEERTVQNGHVSVPISVLPDAGLAAIASRCMQPSKLTGRRTIILDTCYGDAPVYSQVGSLAVREPSFASTVVQAIGREDTDVYAAEDSMVCVRKDGGVYFYTKDADGEHTVPCMVKLSAKVHKSGSREVSDYVQVHREKVESVYGYDAI